MKENYNFKLDDNLNLKLLIIYIMDINNLNVTPTLLFLKVKPTVVFF